MHGSHISEGKQTEKNAKHLQNVLSKKNSSDCAFFEKL